MIIDIPRGVNRAWDDLTVSTSAVPIPAGVKEVTGFDQADAAVITVADDDIRFRFDGTAPTATVGHFAAAGDQIILRGQSQVDNFQAIRDTSAVGDATLYIAALWS